MVPIKAVIAVIGKKLIELLYTEKIKVLEDLLNKPNGSVLEILNNKRYRSKKISKIWKEIGIKNCWRVVACL